MSVTEDRLSRIEESQTKIADAVQQIAIAMVRLEQQEEKTASIVAMTDDLNKRVYKCESTIEVMQERDKSIKESNTDLKAAITKAAWWIIGLFGSLLLTLLGGITMFLIKS